MRLLSSRLEDLEYFSQVLWDLQDLDQNDEDRRASAVKLRNSRTRTRGAIMTDSQPEADACESRVDAFVSGRQGFIAQMRKVSSGVLQRLVAKKRLSERGYQPCRTATRSGLQNCTIGE